METADIATISDHREVIRCRHCHLNQFVTVSGNCRKCSRLLIVVETEPDPMPPAKPLIDQPGVRTFTAKGCEPVRYVVPDIAFAVRLMRDVMGLSQRDLAIRMDRPRTYVSKVENRKSEPNAQSIENLAGGLNCWPSDLITMGLIGAQMCEGAK
jgi:ribosome-binding protein aMBF1 (putative translation factor)